jgi:hypothetical protein
MAAPTDLAEAPATAQVDEPAGAGRIAVFAAVLSPMVLVLVGFVGSSFDPGTRWVARLSAAALLVGLVSSARRWPVVVTAASLGVYGLGVLWVFALPDGRHPTLMAAALLSGALVALEPFLDRVEARDRTVILPVAAILAVAAAAWLVAMSPLPLRLKITVAEAQMDERAALDLQRAGERAPSGESARPSFECVGGQVPNLDIGPFTVCHRSVGRSQVVYDLGKPFLGLGDKTVAGLVYAPEGEPRLDGACLAPITGAWWEYTRPGDGGACPPGQRRDES